MNARDRETPCVVGLGNRTIVVFNKTQTIRTIMREARQQSICEWASVQPQPPRPVSKLGIALSTLGQKPIHGSRVQPTDNTNGWYIWCGDEMSQNEGFFSPLHVEHLKDYLPMAVEYLDLPPGYRFLIDGANFEDVWFDPGLLEEK